MCNLYIVQSVCEYIHVLCVWKYSCLRTLRVRMHAFYLFASADACYDNISCLIPCISVTICSYTTHPITMHAVHTYSLKLGQVIIK